MCLEPDAVRNRELLRSLCYSSIAEMTVQPTNFPSHSSLSFAEFASPTRQRNPLSRTAGNEAVLSRNRESTLETFLAKPHDTAELEFLTLCWEVFKSIFSMGLAKTHQLYFFGLRPL